MTTEGSLLHFWLWGCNSSWFLPRGHMVTKEYYLKVKMLRGTVRRKRSDLWRGKNSYSIMTISQHIHPFWFGNFSQNTRWRSTSSLHTCQNLHQARNLYQAEIHTGRMVNWVYWGDQRNYAGRTKQYSKTGIPRILPKLEQKLGVMYTKWRRVLPRGQCPITPE